MTQTTQTESPAEVQEAREAVAERLERLARRIRTQTPTATVEEFDAAYSAIVRLAAALRPLMDDRSQP
jgi:hypothetical protein